MKDSVSEKVKELKASFADKSPKQMRTIRNNLNNRIKSFEDETRFGKTLPKVSASHMFFELELKELEYHTRAIATEKGITELENQLLKSNI